jgi:hypothetical protein
MTLKLHTAAFFIGISNAFGFLCRLRRGFGPQMQGVAPDVPITGNTCLKASCSTDRNSFVETLMPARTCEGHCNCYSTIIWGADGARSIRHRLAYHAAAELDRRGIATPTGAKWSAMAVSRIRERLAA